MPVDRALRISSILLASTSFLGLVHGANLPEWLTLLTSSALVFVFLRAVEFKVNDRMVGQISLSTTTWNALVLIGFVGFWIDSVWISKELLPAGIHFLLILMVIKLFNLLSRRDHLHLHAISLVAILAAASLRTDLWYFPIFAAYLLIGVWTLLLFQLTKPRSRGANSVGALLPMPEAAEPQHQVTAQFFWLANGLAAVTFVCTLIIFFIIPRVGAGFYQKGYGENIRTSGFSNVVDLGAIGPIKRDPSVVMRVELPDRPVREAERLYMRGVAFDRYDGRSWANQFSRRQAMDESIPGTFTLRRSRSQRTSEQGPTLRQNILLESLDTPVLFAVPFAETVSGRFLAVQSDPTGALYLPYPSSSRIEYSVISRSIPATPADSEPQPVSYSDSFIRYFLQVPLQAERISALAREIVQAKHSSYEKALAIQEYLSHNYRYSLDAPLAQQVHPLEEFLFSRKTGYCEHYATAMVIMLRTIDIPARLVTGFLATEWNEYGNYYVVRQQDAHAWVEVYFPSSGWIRMDPTPATGEEVGSAFQTWQAMERLLDSIRLRWHRFVVQYSAADQVAVVRELKTGGASAKNLARASLTTFWTSTVTALGKIRAYANRGNVLLFVEQIGFVVMGLGALVWLALARPWNRRFSSKGETGEEQAITALYKRMIRYLSRQGISKPAAMAPLELIRTTQEQWKDASPAVTTITALYCQGRFGQTPLTSEELRSAHDHLRQLMALERS